MSNKVHFMPVVNNMSHAAFFFFLVRFLTPFLMNNTSSDRISLTSVKDVC